MVLEWLPETLWDARENGRRVLFVWPEFKESLKVPLKAFRSYMLKESSILVRRESHLTFDMAKDLTNDA